MEIRTVRFDTLCSVRAGVDFIVIRMQFLFLPAMTVLTLEFIRTPLSVARDCL